MKKTILTLAVLGLSGFSANADATTWPFTVTPSKVSVSDNTNNGGTGQDLEISFASPVSFCGIGNRSSILIKKADSSMWDTWVRLAQGAALAGKQLRIGVSDVTVSTCRVYYMEMQ